jgi:putative ABC transport system permease protein
MLIFKIILKSLLRNKLINTILILSIAIAVSVACVLMKYYLVLSYNPLANKNDVVYSIRLDNWQGDEAFDRKNPVEPPWQISFRDSQNLKNIALPKSMASMYRIRRPIQKSNSSDVNPFISSIRVTEKGLFDIFDYKFIYGKAWNSSQNGEALVVITKRANEKLFDGDNSIGETVSIDSSIYTVVGVVDNASLSPKIYDMNHGPSAEIEDYYIPFNYAVNNKIRTDGNVRCWSNDKIDTTDDLMNSECLWIQHWVELKNSNDIKGYRSLVNSYISEEQKINRFKEVNKNRFDTPEELLIARDVISSGQKNLIISAWTFAFLTVINTAILFFLIFWRRRKDYMIIIANGVSKFQLCISMLIEALIIGFVSGLLSIIFSIAGIKLLKSIATAISGSIFFDSSFVANSFLLAIIFALVASIYAVFMVARNVTPELLRA